MKLKIYTAEDHNIRENLIDEDALYILKKLHHAGFESYLVGGGVRDLLSNRVPKDFDISTSATPNQVKKVFGRRCMLIGRRFRLAHVLFANKKYIEVATFRSGTNHESHELITRDNEWGTTEEDALRRDFTINALFYEPEEHQIFDYVGGFKDLEENIIKSIGDPVKRFHQDPVRMLRLLKFKARANYTIDPADIKALKSCRSEILKSSPMRILEEFFKVLEGGDSLNFFRLLEAYSFMEILLPIFKATESDHLKENFFNYLNVVDNINKNSHSPLSRAAIATAFFFPFVEDLVSKHCTDDEFHFGSIMNIRQDIMLKIEKNSFFPFPKRLLHQVSYIIDMQFRFTSPLDKRIYFQRFLRHPDFSTALQFLKIRSLFDEKALKAYNIWQRRWYASKNKS